VTKDLSAADTQPAWSPDSKRIAFASDRNGPFEIYVVDADGSGLTRLTRSPCARGPTCSGHQEPQWSAGDVILFLYGHDGIDERCEVRLANGRVTCVAPTPTPEPCQPAEITPDGKTVRCR
jgi:Tol biopolymer transport system component